MIDEREVLEQAMRRFEPEPGLTERIYHRRDRKRRNQRIAAGVVGIAAFVAALWIVTSVSLLDRSEKSLVPGGEVTGPAETAPPPARASAAPEVVSKGECSAGASSRLELTFNIASGSWIKVRFEVYRSPVGHPWHIVFRHATRSAPPRVLVFFEGTRVAGDSGDLVVQRPYVPGNGGLFKARAVDTQTDQVCKAQGEI